MTNRYFYLKPVLVFAMVLVFSISGSVFGADRYRVSTQVFHLGEMIAQPVIDVVAGKTTGGKYSVQGESEYTLVVLLRPVATEKVSVSMQFSSGKINIQPNLLVNIGEETSAAIDKTLLKLMVQEIAEPGQLTRNESHLSKGE